MSQTDPALIRLRALRDRMSKDGDIDGGYIDDLSALLTDLEETQTPRCTRCGEPMEWTATAPVINARMEWRCFKHADLGTTDGGPPGLSGRSAPKT
jgi:hypothetical protein